MATLWIYPCRMEVDGWDPSLEEELGVSLDELRKWIEEAVEKSEIVQRKRAQLSELQKLVEKKEEEEAQTESLLIDARQYAALPRSCAVRPWLRPGLTGSLTGLLTLPQVHKGV